MRVGLTVQAQVGVALGVGVAVVATAGEQPNTLRTTVSAKPMMMMRVNDWPLLPILMQWTEGCTDVPICGRSSSPRSRGRVEHVPVIENAGSHWAGIALNVSS